MAMTFQINQSFFKKLDYILSNTGSPIAFSEDSNYENYIKIYLEFIYELFQGLQQNILLV